jgi:acetylglutamate kinase
VATRPLLLKFGGELLEDRTRLESIVAAVASIAATRVRLAIVHGGGREIDAALKTAGIEKRQVDGLRITDEATLDVVVAVLAGTVNTRFVAALGSAGVAAVGLTGVDGGCARVDAAPPHRSVEGPTVDLGRVGVPADDGPPRLLTTLMGDGFVPVVASIAAGAGGQLFNVNADTLAGDLAGRLGAARLVIAGTTPGVLDEAGSTIARLDRRAIAQLIDSGTATAGMVAKLRACDQALAAGVDEVMIVDGRDRSALEQAAAGGRPATATRLTAAVAVDAVGSETRVRM